MLYINQKIKFYVKSQNIIEKINSDLMRYKNHIILSMIMNNLRLLQIIIFLNLQILNSKLVRILINIYHQQKIIMHSFFKISSLDIYKFTLSYNQYQQQQHKMKLNNRGSNKKWQRSYKLGKKEYHQNNQQNRRQNGDIRDNKIFNILKNNIQNILRKQQLSFETYIYILMEQIIDLIDQQERNINQFTLQKEAIARKIEKINLQVPSQKTTLIQYIYFSILYMIILYLSILLHFKKNPTCQQKIYLIQSLRLQNKQILEQLKILIIQPTKLPRIIY
ncbi:unnamed protein product (macronuclear) [Paramecium tetraurelia]|uniref:Transmembrane protein n=1 Tax=Paramecium tetraurelia TaxID=5888 RepID=A0BWV7_PARTE|nr:uncharacterized protein GSPATT00032876001 [Paramecium tetraurelia]CAK63024.1 unnamed protein product [Paramecium tetraurelia]|eukprot:XP_001430422.1 hypothetical protein (macronuclear) [Paramecium tetraurelia strain d4-2]